MPRGCLPPPLLFQLTFLAISTSTQCQLQLFWGNPTCWGPDTSAWPHTTSCNCPERNKHLQFRLPHNFPKKTCNSLIIPCKKSLETPNFSNTQVTNKEPRKHCPAWRNCHRYMTLFLSSDSWQQMWDHFCDKCLYWRDKKNATVTGRAENYVFLVRTSPCEQILTTHLHRTS